MVVSGNANHTASTDATRTAQRRRAVPCAGRLLLPAGGLIKGNASSGIYHQTGDQFYEETVPEECFAIPQEAGDAGYRAAKV